jgi:predicted site-specific integrase-resolvase
MASPRRVALYARVSTNDQRADLQLHVMAGQGALLYLRGTLDDGTYAIISELQSEEGASGFDSGSTAH